MLSDGFLATPSTLAALQQYNYRYRETPGLSIYHLLSRLDLFGLRLPLPLSPGANLTRDRRWHQMPPSHTHLTTR